MATKKQAASPDTSAETFEQIKEEIITLVTGQDPEAKEFNYMALVKRVSVILIAVYGIGKSSIVRQLAFSIASTLITRWLAMKAVDSTLPAPAVATESAGAAAHKRVPVRRRSSR